jgi:large subunit ribosomal protein L10
MKMEKPKAHIAKWKKESVDEFVKLFLEYPIIGVVNMENLPASQLQKMRTKLRSTAMLKMTKKRLLHLVIEKVKDKKKGIEELKVKLKGMPAIIFTKDNPFKLYKTLQKAKTKTAAKPGQIAPHDIIIPAGPTGFPPGPIIGELGQAGIKAGVEGGKVVVKEDKIIAKTGDIIDSKKSGLMAKFNIKPIEIGIDLVAVYEDGIIFGKDVLAVDEAEFIAKVEDAARYVMNLSVEISFFTKDNTDTIIAKAFREAKAVSLETKYLTKDTVDEILAKVNNEALALKQELNL